MFSNRDAAHRRVDALAKSVRSKKMISRRNMHILVTGGTGLIGRHLILRLLLLGQQVSVVTRDVAAARVALWSGLAQQQNLDGIDAVINLAGEPIADKRWTEQQKQRLCESRWQITECIAD